MEPTRRVFLKTTAAAGVTLAAGGLGGVACGNPVDAPPEIDAVVDASGMLTVTLAQAPSLAAIGGAVTVRLTVPADATFALPPGDALLIVHPGPAGDANEWIAVQSMCPHLGCPLGYSPTDKLIECPCHSSRFLAAPDAEKDPIGTVVHAPAMTNVASYSISLDPATQTLLVDFGTCTSAAVLPAPVGGVITFAVATIPALQVVDGWVVAQVDGACANHLILIRTDMNTVDVLSAICTHLQCDVSFDAPKPTAKPPTPAQIHCYCHDSLYGLDGVVTQIAQFSGWKGPQAPLKKYPSTLTSGTVTIQFS